MNLQKLNAWRCDQVATLLFCLRDDDVLLIHKKRGLGAGKINGPGGKLEPNEGLAACASRETLEETGISAEALVDSGVLCFSFSDGFSLRVHPFISRDFSGTLRETEEARPFWQPINDIPFERMWADDQYWLPHVLAGGRAYGQFQFEGDRLLEQRLILD